MNCVNDVPSWVISILAWFAGGGLCFYIYVAIALIHSIFSD